MSQEKIKVLESENKTLKEDLQFLAEEIQSL